MVSKELHLELISQSYDEGAGDAGLQGLSTRQLSRRQLAQWLDAEIISENLLNACYAGYLLGWHTARKVKK